MSTPSGPDLKILIPVMLDSIKQLETIYGPVSSKMAAKYATEFEAKKIGDRSPPSVETMQEFVKLPAALMSDQRPFAITNLGSLDKIGILLQMGDLRVESFFGVISPGILADAIALIVYTINGIMHFHIHYMEPATSTTEVKKFTGKAMNLLESAIKQPSTEKTR